MTEPDDAECARFTCPEVGGVASIAGNTLADLLRASDTPPQLRTLCSIMQTSRQAMFVLWGPARQLFYNAPYGVILAERHPGAFGKHVFDVWSDIVDSLTPLVERAYAGEAIHMDDIRFVMRRNGVPQEAHFSFSYTPVFGDSASEVLGVYCACAETTALVLDAKLRAAEEVRRLRLFENAPGFIAVLRGPTHVFEFANAAYFKASGGRDLIGKTVREAFPEVEQQGLIVALDRVYASGERYVAHDHAIQLQPHPPLPARTRFLDFVYEPIVDAAGTVTGIFIEGFDTTEAAQSRERAQASDARRRQVLDSMAEGFIVLDEDFRLLEINAEGLRLDGRPEHVLLGRTHWDLWPASVGTVIETHYRQVMKERRESHLQHRYIGEGHDVFLDVRVYPVLGGIAAFYRDVTALARAGEALSHSHDRFRAAMQATGVMWTNSAKGRMHGPQPGWAALTGQTEAEYSGVGWSAVVHPEDAQPTLEAWNRAVAERRTFTFEHRVRRRDGAWRRFAIRAVPVTEADGRLREWVGVHIDITEAALAAEALRAADRRKDEFLATLAHELRNPLAPIRTAAALLNRPELPPERMSWACAVIMRQSETMARLLDELLDLSRVRNGTVRLNIEPVDLADLVGVALETVQPLISEKEHRLVIELPESPVVLGVDRLRAAQVLINLLTNAAKYTDPQGCLRLVASAGDTRVRIEIIDNGIGLTADSTVDIFAMFTQVDAGSGRAAAGLGIGLALSRRLVELQGGTIEAWSAGLGLGSAFRLSFPLFSAVRPHDN